MKLGQLSQTNNLSPLHWKEILAYFYPQVGNFSFLSLDTGIKLGRLSHSGGEGNLSICDLSFVCGKCNDKSGQEYPLQMLLLNL